MGLIKDIQYTYKDVTIVPGKISFIEHRKECIPYYGDGMLPLFTAPMDTVLNDKNYSKFIDNKINAIIPRTVSLDLRKKYAINGLWTAFSLIEFEELFCNEDEKLIAKDKLYILIDIANGHMNKILVLSEKAKKIYGDGIIIMAGNIANPKTYLEYAKAGIDYIRCGIGSGFGCLSTSNTGVHFPMASLIDEIKKMKTRVENHRDSYKSIPKIVADGGIRGFADIIKALALGADYVMIGSVFAKMFESAAPKTANSDEWFKLPLYTRLEDLTDFTVDNAGWRAKYNGKDIFLGDIQTTFYGMASREGQIAMNGKKTKTSEGLSKKIKVEYTMKGWVENFTDYLCSSMSYTGNFTLDDFINKTNLIVNSKNAVEVVNK